MSIRKLRQVYVVPQGDFAAAVTLHQDLLGLELQFRDGDEWAQFAAGDISLALAGPREAQGAAPGTSVPVFETDDLDGLLAAAAARGLLTGAVRDMGAHGRTATINMGGGGSVYAFLQKAGPQKPG